jgi:predicted amidohydrolase
MSKVAVVQLSAFPQKLANLALAVRFIHEAKRRHAEMVVFPEFLMAYSPAEQSAEELSELAENVEGNFAAGLRAAAKENGIDVVATIYEKSGAADRVYDTALLIDREGSLAAVYRKLHLYNALGSRESDKLVAGDELAKPVATKVGHIGMMICYDIRFPELPRLLALMGADTLVAPSAWVQGDGKVEHWRTMLSARALENGCYVIAPNQVGQIYTGHSMVVDPYGKVILDMEEWEGLELVELNQEFLQSVREKLPLLRHRREDVYSKYAGGAKPGEVDTIRTRGLKPVRR